MPQAPNSDDAAAAPGPNTNAWTALFDAYLEQTAERGSDASTTGAAYQPFTQSDYLRFVDGKPRYDGVRDFLASRGFSLPWGDPSDPPDADTIWYALTELLAGRMPQWSETNLNYD